jgi:hypothetical protein
VEAALRAATHLVFRAAAAAGWAALTRRLGHDRHARARFDRAVVAMQTALLGTAKARNPPP